MGVQICACSNDTGNVKSPYSDCSLGNNNVKQQKSINNQQKQKKDSICLPNGNNLNSYYENKDNQNNQNDVEHFDISLSPITNARKNININIININNESSNVKNSSNNRSSNLYYNEKMVEQMKHKSEDNPVKEESLEKEESNNQEEENEKSNENYENDNNEENEKESINYNPMFEEEKQKLIEKFDQTIIKFGEYISDDKLNEFEKSIIKNLEESLEDISICSKNNNEICFARPALLFKKDNTIYKGSWNSGYKKDGFGIFFDSNGNKYVGEWKDDKFNGKGRLFSIHGDYFEGEFHDGVIKGHGMFISKTEGYKYLGEFDNNKFHGHGKLIYDNKITYEGAFVEGYKEGKGRLTFVDGEYYDGHFKRNKYEGKGKFKFKDDRAYNGNWKNNEMDGKGTFTWGSECKYVGDYKKNKREGSGVYTFGCNLYDGTWLNNLPQGEATLLYDGLRIVGNFRYGKLIEMKEGKGVTREMTQKFTIESKQNVKSLDDTFKGIERSEDDIKNAGLERYCSANEVISKKKESNKLTISKYMKPSKKNKSKEKDKDKDKEKDKEKKNKSKEPSKDKSKKKNVKK